MFAFYHMVIIKLPLKYSIGIFQYANIEIIGFFSFCSLFYRRNYFRIYIRYSCLVFSGKSLTCYLNTHTHTHSHFHLHINVLAYSDISLLLEIHVLMQSDLPRNKKNYQKNILSDMILIRQVSLRKGMEESDKLLSGILLKKC